MTGDFTAGSRVLAKWHKEKLEREVWERAHPELTRDWNAALEENWRRAEEAEKAAEDAKARSLVPEKLARLGVPPKCIDHLDSLQSTPAVEAALKFIESDDSFLLLTGSPGAGKTLAASLALAQVVHQTLKERPRIDTWTLARMFCFVRAGEAARVAIQDFNLEAAREFERWRACRWLILDDVGTERRDEQGRWQSRFDELIDTRYGFQAKTLITSNLDGPAFRTRYGDRIVERIREEGSLVSAGRESLRRQGPGVTT